MQMLIKNAKSNNSIIFIKSIQSTIENKIKTKTYFYNNFSNQKINGHVLFLIPSN